MIYRNLKYFYLVVIAILLIILAFKSCNNKVITTNNEPIKANIKKLEVKKVAEQIKANKSDSVRTKYVIKWRTKIHDSIIYKECEELILICDTIIKEDSIQIKHLKYINSLNDSIINEHKVIIYNDSIDIKCLKKSIRKERRQKNLVLLGLGVLGGLLIVK